MSMHISTQGRLDPDAQIVLGPEHITSAKQLNKDLWRPDRHDLADELFRALRQLVGDEPRSSRRVTLFEEYDVSAFSTKLDGRSYAGYARLAAYSLDTMQERARLLQTTRMLGSSTDLGPSSLDDVRHGPIAILEAADVDATVEVRLESFFELKSNQRAALLTHLQRLTPGVDVVLTALQPTLLNLVEKHGDLLPASVIETAESGLQGPRHVSTRSERRRGEAREALADRGDDHDDWSRLYALYQEPNQQATYDELEANTLINVRTREALRKWAGRMADLSMIERTGPTTARRVRLLPKGVALLDEHPTLDIDLPTPNAAGRTDVSSQPMEDSQRSQQSTVSDPPKTTDSSVDAPTARDRGGDRPADEAATATAGGSDAASRAALDVEFLDDHEHDALMAMVADGDIALCNRSADETDDARQTQWSYLPQRDEAIVRVHAARWGAHTMVRLCSALLSEPAFQQVLTVNRLAGGPEKDGLGGLPIDNPVVLRDGACLGWLKNQDADAKSFRRRLRQARDALTELSSSIGDLDSADDEAVATLIREAHGLAGVAARLYDMLGVDLNRVLDVQNWSISDVDRRRHFVKLLGKQIACSSRYGVYSANRVLYEAREDKRDQLLGAPDVDTADPTGSLCGSWTLVGDDVDVLEDDLAGLQDNLILQTEGENFAPFLLNVDVVDGNRKAAFDIATRRQTNLKRLKETQQTAGVLRALTSDPIAAAKAVSRLGQEDDQRDLELRDVRHGLSHHDAEEIVPDIGSRVVSRVVQVLLDLDEPVSTGTLADLADTSTQAMRYEANQEAFDDLEAAGLLERVDGGAGKATKWRLNLPFDDERGASSAPNPTPDADNMDSTDLQERPIAGIAEALFAADHRDIDYGSDWFLEGTSVGGDLRPLIRQRPDLVALLELVVALLGWDARELPIRGAVRDGADAGLVEDDVQVTMGLDPSPGTEQQSITAAAD